MNSATFPPIPHDTAKAAEAILGKSNHYVVIGDRVNELFAGLSLTNPLGSSPSSVQKLASLYLITIFQHLETLPDQLAVDAYRERVDWKYALHAPLKPLPLKVSALCEFRQIILADPASCHNLARLLERLAGIPQVALCECLNKDPHQVIRHVCRISQLANIWKVINEVLEVLAIKEPKWLLSHSLPHWYERYSPTRRNLDLRSGPHEQEAFVRAIGGDGFYLLDALSGSATPELASLPEVTALRKVWRDQFEFTDEGNGSWPKEACAGCHVPGFMAHAMTHKTKQRIGEKNE